MNIFNYFYKVYLNQRISVITKATSKNVIAERNRSPPVIRNTIIAKIVAGKNSSNRLKKSAKINIIIKIIIKARHKVAPTPMNKLILWYKSKEIDKSLEKEKKGCFPLIIRILKHHRV